MDRSPLIHPEGLYVHLPFCTAFCSYCDFASEFYASARVRSYLAVLERELSMRVAALGGTFAPRTVFLGGGTPSALSADELTRFFGLLERHMDLRHAVEFTIEANPGSTTPGKLELLRQHGVNRISFGVQSFQPHLLKLLNRIHSADQGREAVRLARAAGFDNVSIDLLHGVPRQTLEDLRRDLGEALALQTDHISAYGLIYEDGTPLTAAASAGKIERLAPEAEAEQYMTVVETLERGGLQQYETSSYARPGRQARHNLIYWHNEAYMGLGVSAAGFVNFERTVNFDKVDTYTRALEQGQLPVESRETLTPEARAREALVLHLRLREGVDPSAFAQRWGLDPLTGDPVVAKFLKEGLMEITAAGRYRISRKGLAVADGILSELV